MVLEARANAEKVWYPIVWEKIKDADNVVDYDIRDEITKDTAAEINANNQTTTGMANVIPWVNAPKLLESTSIIRYDKDKSVSITGSVTWEFQDWNLFQYWGFSYTSNWDLNYWNSNNSLTIPENWAYRVELTWWDWQQWLSPTTWDKNTFYIKKNWTIIASDTFAYRTKWTVQWIFSFNKWDVITFRVSSDTGAYWTRYCSAIVNKV